MVAKMDDVEVVQKHLQKDIYYQREAIMAILLWTPAWSDPEPEPEPKPKPKPNSSLNGFKFFHIIYTMSDNKLVEIAFNTAMLYGLWTVYWDIANPLTVQTSDEVVHHIKDIFRPPRFDTSELGDIPGKE